MQFGPYRIEREVARGGVGVLYQARDQAGRSVALKLLQLSGERTMRRFAREARAVSQVVHPHVARYLDAGVHQGTPYLVLDFVEGCSLAERLSREGRLPVGEVRRIGFALCDALRAVHAQGLLHRDLKPANVLEGADGRVVLTDFGLVRQEGGQSQTLSLTLTGASHGTPGFWPPEQARGQLDALGPHSDVYGLAATLYALLSGRPPRSGETLVRAIEASDAPVPPLRREDVPPELERVLLAALSPDPQRRPTLAELKSALRAQPQAAPPRTPWVVGVGTALSVALSVLLVTLYLRSRSAPEPGVAATAVGGAPVETPAPPPTPTPPEGFRVVVAGADQPWSLEPRSASWVEPGRTLLLHAAQGAWLVDLESPEAPTEVPGTADAQLATASPDALYLARGAELTEVPLERAGGAWRALPARTIPLQRAREVTDLVVYGDRLCVAALAEAAGQCARYHVQLPYQNRVTRFGDMPVGGRPLLSRALPGGGFVWMAGDRGATIVELPSERPLGRPTGAPLLAVLQLEPTRALLVWADGRWELGEPGERTPGAEGRFAAGLRGVRALDRDRVLLDFGQRVELYDLTGARVVRALDLPPGEETLSVLPTADAVYVWTRRGALLRRDLRAD